MSRLSVCPCVSRRCLSAWRTRVNSENIFENFKLGRQEVNRKWKNSPVRVRDLHLGCSTRGVISSTRHFCVLACQCVDTVPSMESAPVGSWTVLGCSRALPGRVGVTGWHLAVPGAPEPVLCAQAQGWTRFLTIRWEESPRNTRA